MGIKVWSMLCHQVIANVASRQVSGQVDFAVLLPPVVIAS